MSTLRPGKKWETKLSSAGLIFHHFGCPIIKEILKDKYKSLEQEEFDKIVDRVFDQVYENFVNEIDAIDNGSKICGHPKYRIGTNITSRVSHLNPSWVEEDPDADKCFCKAMEMVKEEFIDRVRYYGEVWWPAREKVSTALKASTDKKNQDILELEKPLPWKDHLLELGYHRIKFVIFPESDTGWRIQAVPAQEGGSRQVQFYAFMELNTLTIWFQVTSSKDTSLTGRFDENLSKKRQVEEVMLLWHEWRGLHGQELEDKSGIENIIFVHPRGYIGGHRDRGGVIAMAQKTITAYEVLIDKAVEGLQVNGSEQIMELADVGFPWVERIFQREAEGRLKKDWRGHSKKNPRESAEMENIEFVKEGGELGGHTLREGAILMATKSLMAHSQV
ncbi:unnamed protein product [Darwinula stevensoni]|uniref:Uncharacterized protein n=1 Tax=Darwinula stevensoni TaxID=69355 RepID=A0A7R9A231_9CRUS|nr:unnamed protein product [Darwinula stevensoni]CAG0887854.1 unnamed protein product [Darwinula stevensoni]